MSTSASVRVPCSAFGTRPDFRSANGVRGRGRALIVAPRASREPLNRSRSSERGVGKSAAENEPRQHLVHSGTDLGARPVPTIVDGNEGRARAVSVGATSGNGDTQAKTPHAGRGSSIASAVGLVDAPETETSTRGDKRTTSRRKGGKNFIRKYKSSLKGLDGATDLDSTISESLERLLGDDFETYSESNSYESTLHRLDTSAARFAALHPSANVEKTKTTSVASVELKDGDAVVRVGMDGTIVLLRVRTEAEIQEPTDDQLDKTDPQLLVVSKACVGLPIEAQKMIATVTRVSFDANGKQCACELTWGDDLSAPICTLLIEKASCDDSCQVVEDLTSISTPNNSSINSTTPTKRTSASPWNSNLHDGFIFDFNVFLDKLADPDHASAEFVVDLRTSGDWFGGGHLMRQHWPLNSGCWEVGPHYPFDNGPNGVNTLVSNNWVSSKGVAVLCDPDTPYLHVGLNAPTSNFFDNMGGSNRSFGVGIQNAARHILPMDCTHHNPDSSGRKGDGSLRLQARSRFAKGKGAFQMDHPMIGWESSFDSYDDIFDTYDFGDESFDDDSFIEPHVEKQIERKSMLRKDEPNRTISMRVGLCALPDVKRATQTCLKTLPRPDHAPPPEVIRAPIWTTWARYKQNVDQQKTMTFAREILNNNLPASVMEIDDKWQAGYGELDFDLAKFPDPKAMVDELHSLGFKVTLWVMPFCEENTDAYREGSALNYFVTSKHPQKRLKPGFFKWWNTPPVVALDVTNPAAVDWFVSRLQNLQHKYGIDGFKFDAGEPCFLPRMFETFEALGHPSEYTRYWVERVASKFELAEVRTGHGTTGVGVLTRMGDRFSEWSSGNGLRSIIPTLLTSGVMGYPFCLPDMIGGNAYFGRRPDRELLVRWAQANALMPAMQFSIAPWESGADVSELIAGALSTREKIVDQMVELTGEACKTLTPMCRPMWWLDPSDKHTHRIGDQFAVGDDVIVAPVVVKGAVTRDIYLTQGSWVDLDDDNGEVFQGSQWLIGYDAPLSKLPCFVRVP